MKQISSTFFFLFVCSFSSHQKIFHSVGEVTFTGEGLQILTYARHWWPLSSEGCLACHTYCDTRHPFIMVISQDPRHSNLLASVWQWSCWHVNTCFKDLSLSQLWFEHPTFHSRVERSNPLRHRRGHHC